MCKRSGVTIILGVICGLQNNFTGQKIWAKTSWCTVMMLFKNDIKHTAGALQLSAGQAARVEELRRSYTLIMIFFRRNN